MSRILFLGINALVFLLMLASPWAASKRDFDGTGYLLNPLGVINPKGLTIPDGLSFGWLGPMFVVWIVLLLLASAAMFLPNPQTRSRLLYILGGIGVAFFALEAYLFYQAINSANAAAIAGGATRPPLRRFSMGLGAYIGLFYSLVLLIMARMQLPGGRAFFVRYRAIVVPLVSLMLAVLAGGLIVTILRPGLGTQGVTGLGLREMVASKLDLVTYVYQILFSPLISFTGILQSLYFATPLIFAGTALAFGFRAGLFNIGAPGQITLGAVMVMIVGVYVHLPGWLLLPLTLLAAMVGGGIWGAIPGWLKARFGANEVINTIMMNYVASSIFLFLIGANEYKFFGQTVHLPFKSEGFEAKSAELLPGARLPFMRDIVAPGGEFSWALPLAAIAGVAVYYLTRRLELGRRLLFAAVAVVAAYLVGGFLPGFPVTITPTMRSVNFNGAFLISILALLFYNFYLFRTAAGYELRAAGLAPKAAEYAGVNLNRKIILAMALSGALAGLVASHYVMGGAIDAEYRLKQNINTGVGFDGIAVALMGQNAPLGIFFSATLFGVLLAGAPPLNSQLGISPQLIQVLQAMIILFIAVGGLLPRYFTDPLRAAQVETEARAELEAHQAKTAKAAGD